jgi:hypothetical protein
MEDWLVTDRYCTPLNQVGTHLTCCYQTVLWLLTTTTGSFHRAAAEHSPTHPSILSLSLSLSHSRRLASVHTKSHHVGLAVSISPFEGNFCAVVGTINSQCTCVPTQCHQYHHFIITVTHVYVDCKPLADITASCTLLLVLIYFLFLP